MNINDFPEATREPHKDACPTCAGETYIERKGKHIGWYCDVCGWIKWLPQKAEAFIMPFGKYKGKTLQEIKDGDYEYLEWALKNIVDRHINKKIKEVIENETVLDSKI